MHDSDSRGLVNLVDHDQKKNLGGRQHVVQAQQLLSRAMGCCLGAGNCARSLGSVLSQDVRAKQLPALQPYIVLYMTRRS